MLYLYIIYALSILYLCFICTISINYLYLSRIGATHIVFKVAVAAINFATGESELAVSSPTRIAIGSRKESIELTPYHLPANLGNTLSIICIEFVQEVNGVDYSLQNGAFNAMSIVGVA